MRSGIASKDIFRLPSGEVVLAQIPSTVHGTLVGAATLDASYCPTCSPSVDAGGAPEHAFTKMRHEKLCARTRPDL